jgi:hypothetical protein
MTSRHEPEAAAQEPARACARALCSASGRPEHIKFEGKPMWQSYLPEVDTVLKAALSPEEWERIRSGDNF